MENTTQIHPVFSSFISPLKFMEAKVWLEKETNKELASTLKGNHGESLLHWAALSEISLLMDVAYNVDLDVNVQDANGLTPMDWLLERLKMASQQLELTYLNKTKMQLQTDDLASLLWGLNGRPSKPIKEYIPLLGICGLWRFIQTIEETEGADCLLDLDEEGRNILFYTIDAPNNPGRLKFLNEWSVKWCEDKKITKKSLSILNLNSTDKKGRNLLWWITDELLKPDKELQKKHYTDLTVLIEHVVNCGGDPLQADNEGISPTMLVLTKKEASLSTKEFVARLLHQEE